MGMTLARNLTTGLALAIGIVGGTVSADAQNEWDLLASTTAQWWQYVNSIPPAVNPLVDPSGAFCMVSQRDPIWFLAGTFFGGTAVRTCAVPAGEWLFFPVINSFFFNTPSVCGQGASVDAATARAAIAPFIDAATNMSVKVDRKPVKNLTRIKSEGVCDHPPVDNIWNAGCVDANLGTVPAGIYSPSGGDGYYVFLKPLSIGNHTLYIHAEVPSQSFVLDVTYHLVVTSVDLN